MFKLGEDRDIELGRIQFLGCDIVKLFFLKDSSLGLYSIAGYDTDGNLHYLRSFYSLKEARAYIQNLLN